MRIDLEQFLAVTVMLGTAGAIGVGVYSMQDDDSSESSDLTAVEAGLATDLVTPKPAVEPKVVVSQPRPVAAPPTSSDLQSGDAPGPDVETPDW